MLCTFFFVDKPGSGVIGLKVGSNACGLVKLKKAHNLTLSLDATGIIYDLVEIQLNLLGNGLKVSSDIKDLIALKVLGNSTLWVVAQIIS